MYFGPVFDMEKYNIQVDLFRSILLQPDDDFPLRPELFELVVLAHIRGVQVQHHASKIDHYPTVLWAALDPAFVIKFVFNSLDRCICQAVKHAVAGTAADYEIIGKSCLFLDIQEEDIFPLFFF